MTEEQRENYQKHINQMEATIKSIGEALTAANEEIFQRKNEYQNLLNEYSKFPMNQIPYIDFLISDARDRIQELELRISNYERGLDLGKIVLKKYKLTTGME